MKAPTTPTAADRVNALWGRQLRQHRLDKKITQVDFGKKVNRDQGSISRYERGEGVWTPEVLLAFAIALDTTVPRLFPWPEMIEEMEKFRLQVAEKAVA